MNLHANARTLAISLALVLAPVSTLQAEPMAASGCADMAAALPSGMTLQAGFHKYLSLPEPVTRLAVGDPAVADVALVEKRNLLFQAKKAGATSMMVWTRCSGQPISLTISVSGPSVQMARGVTQAQIQGLPSQVQTDIRFVELSRSRLRDLGTSFAFRSAHRPNLFTSPQFEGTVSMGSPVSGADIDLNTDTFNIIWGGSSSRFLAAINLMEETGYAYTLSRPSLVAMSGQTAHFLAGGEVPIPVPQGNNAIGIEFKEFGVRLSLTPTIVSRGKIVLKVAPEVSDLDFSNALTISGAVIPALRVRRTDTSVSLGDGESFIISGLISRSTLSNAGKLPGLGDLPVLGALFRSTRFETEDRELLMIVTPRLVQPLATDAKMPPLPGEELRTYDPSAATLFFLGDKKDSSGIFTGLSR